ncbi:MAG: hypothetical protein AAGI53_15375 [Planctomycetota bacterium]
MSIRSVSLIVAGLTANTLAGPVPVDSGVVAQTEVIGFEDFQTGSSVSFLDFGAVTATVTYENPTRNMIFEHHDGYGAVTYAGDKAWKISGGEVIIDFGDASLTHFGFWYSDLEWATLRVTAGDTVVDLNDSNSRNPKWFEIATEEGQTFQSVSLEFIGHQNDGVGLDGLTVGLASVPNPPVGVGIVLAGAFAARRRRR